MNDATPILPPTLAAHADAMARHGADDARIDAAQSRLLAALPAARPRRASLPRFALAAASFCALAVFGLALFLGQQGPAFAAVQQRLRDFDTLRVRIEQRIGGQSLPSSTLQLDRSGSLRTDVGNDVSVVVDTRSGHVLTLLHGARLALRTPLPAGPAPRTEDALQWLDAIRAFQGEAQPLDEVRRDDGIDLYGWRLQTHGMQIDLWADADGVPRSMQVGGAQDLVLDYRFAFDLPIAPGQLSADVPPGYTLGEDDAG
ncbi:hypothetical protein [Chiayiivirga flava]|uniref:DUF2092 domain-containing protein n=1 Tax=Chiayiivirga flava TaxID=659595 RepID=A0A7W8D6I2_9GAMM|nr:hypothetical protein [Chiayiivirga flava]MBB5207602.1 hypothetical protein [Chiayiivirga flava]